jgi:SpoVK/Ycf46/Vps4 family AAA+-type ATPase
VVPNHSGSRSEQHQWIAVRRDALADTLRFFHRAVTNGRKRVRVFGGEDYFLPSPEERPYSWDDVLLDEARQSLVRQDFEHFLERRDWFAARRVPWRRGYLFHGPPGNGKTSAVRAMASHPEVSAFSIDFADKDTSDYDVSRLFEAAADHSPGLILLEDFDRVFTKTKESEERNCSYSHLLNCLDGLSGREGTIVVATANHPELLDEAILRRPGRFDRVIHFPLPDQALRERYFESLCPNLRGQLRILAAATERMSFAQLREVWLLASQTTASPMDEASLPDLESALVQVKREQSLASRGKLGFEIPEDEKAGDFSTLAATMKL